MYTEIIKNETQINLGDRIYIVTEQGNYQRKINWLGEHFVEWNCGFCSVNELLPNPNKKSKIKFIIEG